MDTLYDLLGALPQDDAESLRTAFRRAVKGAHPDLRPGDPDAGQRFRQIVRANQILGDPEQRAVYDHLLVLAGIEKNPASAHPIAAKIHRVASGVLAVAIASIVTVGGYLVFMHMSMALVAPANNVEASVQTPPQVAAASVSAPAAVTEEVAATASIPRPETSGDPIVPRAVPVTRVDGAPQDDRAPPLNIDIGNGASAEPATNGGGYFRSHGISAYRGGDPDGAIIDPDQAAVPDAKSSASYLHRGMVFYRMRKYGRVFADVAPAKQIATHARQIDARAKQIDARAKQIAKGRNVRLPPTPPRKLHLEQAMAAVPARPRAKPPAAAPVADSSLDSSVSLFKGDASATFQ
jgi:hypothetical protein